MLQNVNTQHTSSQQVTNKFAPVSEVLHPPRGPSSYKALQTVKMPLGLQFDRYESNYDNFKLQEVIAMLCNGKINMLFDEFFI